jgi:hypothetical protein
MCISIVSPAYYSSIQHDSWEHIRISQLIYIVFRRLGLFLVTIKAVYYDDTRIITGQLAVVGNTKLWKAADDPRKMNETYSTIGSNPGPIHPSPLRYHQEGC